MIGGGSQAELWTMALIAVAVTVGVTRPVLWRRSAPAPARGPAWRLAALIALQLLAGVLLHLTLFPPKAAMSSGRLVIATRGATDVSARQPGDVLVSLPEAGAVAGAIRAPDLASALRRHPEAGRLLINGEGLVPRDHIALDRIAEFVPGPPPRGFVSLSLPNAVAPGARFSVGGQIGALPTGVVELVDPANTVVERSRVAADGYFRLSAATRAPGQALFDLRLREPSGRLVEQIAVPVDVRPQRQPRVLVLAGAPGPEVKYLQRWAQDGGIDLRVQIDVGAGIEIGDTPVALDRASLSQIDLVVIDDRRWETLQPHDRAALQAATRAGLGLLLRPTGPLSPATRRDWAGLGVSVAGGETVLPLRLDGESPALNRRDFAHEATDAVSIVEGAGDAALASWRPLGRGRVGLWTVTDSYGLLLRGRSDRYSDLWSQLFSALARPGDDDGAHLDGMARRGMRASLCHVSGQARVVGPDGSRRPVQVDPATGSRSCAAFWPDQVGWRLIRHGDGREAAFYVHPADAAPSLMQAANREATTAMVRAAPMNMARAVQRAPGSAWPWAAALMVAFGALWWLERRRSATWVS